MNEGHRPDGEDDVGALIRLAGRQPSVSSDRTARVRAAVRQEWLGAVWRRRKRRLVWGAAALAAVVLLILVTPVARRWDRGSSRPSTSGAFVVSVSAPAWVGGGPDGTSSPGAAPLRTGERLSFGSTVETTAEGRVALRLSSADSMRLDSGSRLRVVDADTVALDRGAVYVDSGGGLGRIKALAIETPFGSVRELGTQYEVRVLEESLRIRVREGTVSLHGGSRVHEVPVAQELLLGADGSATMRPIPIHGPEWDWVARITTLPDLDGETARTFLDHVTRERGWRLLFADERAERAAVRVRIGGSIAGLSLDHALDAVLPTCGMAYRVEEGTLIVSLAGDGS